MRSYLGNHTGWAGEGGGGGGWGGGVQGEEGAGLKGGLAPLRPCAGVCLRFPGVVGEALSTSSVTDGGQACLFPSGSSVAESEQSGERHIGGPEAAGAGPKEKERLPLAEVLPGGSGRKGQLAPSGHSPSCSGTDPSEAALRALRGRVPEHG